MAQQPRSWRAGFPARADRVPADLAAPIATTGDGRDITQPWVGDLQQARDPRLHSSVDWGVYERIRKDAQVKSCMEQRIRAVVSRDWDVLPGDEAEPRSIAAAEALKDAVEAVGWDLVTEKMLWATFYGYSVGELMWGAAKGLLAWVPPTLRTRAIHVRHARRFRFGKAGDLRLLTAALPSGEVLPERKFWVVTAGGTDDDSPYGEGLADWLYFPVLFKRNGVRFWNIFLDKFSVPTAMGKYPRGTTRDDVGKFLNSLMAIANDSGFVVPEGMSVELLQLAQSGADFAAVCRYMDGEIAKIILSQTMTTDNGSSRSQGEVHADVKLEIVKADADLLSDSFNNGPARWFTDLNFGADVASPRLIRIVEEEDDLKAAADTDSTLKTLGWERDDESFKDRYGDGYRRSKPVDAGERDGQGTADAPAAEPTAPPAAEPDANVVPLSRKIALAEAIAEALVPHDAVDEAVDAALADAGWIAAADAVVADLVERLQDAASADEVATIITEVAAGDDADDLAERLARAGFALRIDAATGGQG